MGAPYSHKLAALRLASGVSFVLSGIIAFGLLYTLAWSWPNFETLPLVDQVRGWSMPAAPLVAGSIACLFILLKRPSPWPEIAFLSAFCFQTIMIIFALFDL